jgi:hypothetical protein
MLHLALLPYDRGDFHFLFLPSHFLSSRGCTSTRLVRLVEFGLLENRARVAEKAVTTGKACRLGHSHLNASLFCHLVSENRRDTAATTAEGRDAVTAAIISHVFRNVLVSEARATRDIKTIAWIVAALARSLGPLWHDVNCF